MRLRILCAFAVAVALAGACGQDDAPGPDATPVPSVLPSETAAPSSPPAATTAEAAATGLYDAWLDGDAGAAAAFATPQAIAELFAHPGNEIQFNSCSRTGAKYRCFFYYEGGGLNMDVEGNATSGFLVTKAFFVAD